MRKQIPSLHDHILRKALVRYRGRGKQQVYLTMSRAVVRKPESHGWRKEGEVGREEVNHLHHPANETSNTTVLIVTNLNRALQ